MNKRKKKTNKELEKGITWCMSEIYAMKLALQALNSKLDDLGNPHKD